VLTSGTFGADNRKTQRKALLFPPFLSLHRARCGLCEHLFLQQPAFSRLSLSSPTLFPPFFSLSDTFISASLTTCVFVYPNICICKFPYIRDLTNPYMYILAYWCLCVFCYGHTYVLIGMCTSVYLQICGYLTSKTAVLLIITAYFPGNVRMFRYQSMQISQNMWVFSCWFDGKPLSLHCKS